MYFIYSCIDIFLISYDARPLGIGGQHWWWWYEDGLKILLNSNGNLIFFSYDARPLGIGGQHWSDSKLQDRIAFTLRDRCHCCHQWWWFIKILSPGILSLSLSLSAREYHLWRCFTLERRTQASIGRFGAKYLIAKVSPIFISFPK